MRLDLILPGATVLAAAMVVAPAHAGAGKTTEQADAEMAAALRDGTVVSGFQGMPPRAIRPDLYPHKPVVPGKTREQVRAELDAALRDGTVVVVAGFQGIPPRILNPDLYPAPAAARAAVRSREQVEAERAAAVHAGLVTTRFQGMTPYQRASGAN